MITFRKIGNFVRTERYLRRIRKLDYLPILKKYGQIGVEALSAATPIDTGLTSKSWYYDIWKSGRDRYSIVWSNSNLTGSVPIVILLQYGFTTNRGTYVQGRDFVNPALKPIFENIANDIWEEVTRLE